MIYLYLKKVFSKWVSILLMITNITLGLFLFLTLSTIGINVSKGIDSEIQKHPYYTNLYAYKTNGSKELNIKGCYLKECLDEVIINEEKLLIGNGVITSKSDTSILVDYLVEGRLINRENEVLVSQKIFNHIVDKKEITINEKKYTIRGVYLNDNFLNYSLIYLDNIKDYSLLITKADSFNHIEKVKSSLTNDGFDVYGYFDELHAIINYSYIVNTMFIVIGVIICLVSSLIEYYSMKNIFEERLQYFALIKVIGYSNKNVSLLIFIENLLVFLVSAIISSVIYLFFSQSLLSFIDLSKVIPSLQDKAYSLSALSIAFVYPFAFIVTLLIAFKMSRLINKSDIVKILEEARK